MLSTPRPKRIFPLVKACLLLLAASLACEQADPLEALKQQQASGNFEATLEPLRELVAERRDDSEVLYHYGLALARTNQPSLAEWSLSAAMTDPKWLLPAGRQLTYDSLRAGNHDRAIEIAGTVLATYPDNLDILLLRATAYARSRIHYEAALADVDRIFELDPENSAAMEARILSLLGLERIEEAAEAIDELGRRLEKDPLGATSAGWHCSTTAIFAQDSNDEALARERWADCLERFPGNSSVVTSAVQFFDSYREHDRSLDILRAAQQAAPESRSYRTSLASRLRFGGLPQESEELLKQATESERPQSAALAWFDLAKHYQDLGDHSKSSETQARALGVAREAGLPHSQLLLEYADSLLLAGRLDEALQIAEEMTVEAHVAMIRARVAQQQGRHADALEHFDAGFRLWPNNAFARYYAALASEQIGDFDAAIELYRYSIRIAAGATDARTRLGRLHQAEGRPDEALALLRLQSDQAPLDLTGEFLSLRLWGLIGNTPSVLAGLERFRRGSPLSLGRALAMAAEGVHERAGAEAAIALILKSPVDLEAPESAAALRALVRLQHEAGRGQETRSRVDAARRRQPETAESHAIYGLWLELHDEPEPARGAYQAALAIDAHNPGALVGLGGLTSDPEQALALFERAAAAEPDDPRPAWNAVQQLLVSGRVSEAQARLEALLARHPYQARAASALIEMHLDQGEISQRTVELAHRAVRFGRNTDTLERLGQVHRRRNEPELAVAVEALARDFGAQESTADGPRVSPEHGKP
jgi:tetratricopeptide (TPR) repeat protein